MLYIEEHQHCDTQDTRNIQHFLQICLLYKIGAYSYTFWSFQRPLNQVNIGKIRVNDLIN